MRAAVFAGAVDLAFLTIFVAGPAMALQERAPSRAAATLYVGLIGIGGHDLVRRGPWLGVPLFAGHAAGDAASAAAG